MQILTRILLVASITVLSLLRGEALAVLSTHYSFAGIVSSGSHPANLATGETQLRLEVLDLGATTVGFRFTNTGTGASSLTDVYFDDGTLMGISGVTSSSGVSFSQDANPKSLPGGNNINPKFETTAGFSADSNPPTQPNGVNNQPIGQPQEWLQLNVALLPGKDYEDVLDAFSTGELRVGVHVQAFSDGDSASFVNRKPPTSPIPEPTSAMLLGLAGAGLLLRRQRRPAGTSC